MTTNPETKQQFWLTHIQQAEQSGVSLKRYAEQNNVRPDDLYGWRSRLRRQGVLAKRENIVPKKSAMFARVIASSPSLNGAAIQLQVGEVTLHLPCLPDPLWLVRLVSTLAAPL